MTWSSLGVGGRLGMNKSWQPWFLQEVWDERPEERDDSDRDGMSGQTGGGLPSTPFTRRYFFLFFFFLSG
jgi:hypothetical protein